MKFSTSILAVALSVNGALAAPAPEAQPEAVAADYGKYSNYG